MWISIDFFHFTIFLRGFASLTEFRLWRRLLLSTAMLLFQENEDVVFQREQYFPFYRAAFLCWGVRRRSFRSDFCAVLFCQKQRSPFLKRTEDHAPEDKDRVDSNSTESDAALATRQLLLHKSLLLYTSTSKTRLIGLWKQRLI